MPKNMPDVQRLLLFDYDGVVVQPQADSFSILREAMFTTLEKHNGLTLERYDNLDWPAIFEQCKGTTER